MMVSLDYVKESMAAAVKKQAYVLDGTRRSVDSDFQAGKLLGLVKAWIAVYDTDGHVFYPASLRFQLLELMPEKQPGWTIRDEVRVGERAGILQAYEVMLDAERQG